MPVARVYNAAGQTGGFLYETDLPVQESLDDDKLTFSAEISSGPRSGQTATIDLLGSFDVSRGVGMVGEWRESVGPDLHFSLKFDAPVDVSSLFGAIKDAFADGFDFRGNRFGNSMSAGSGDDRLFGAGGDDVLRGLGGDDLVYGGGGANRLFGGTGDDLLEGSGGLRDRLVGGAGDDVYIEFHKADGAGDRIVEKPGGGFDIVRSFSQSHSLPDNVEELQMLGSFDGVVVAEGNDLDNRIFGTDGRDSISGGAGSDTIHGGRGRDSLLASDGMDVIYGGGGGDLLSASQGRHQLFGGSGDDTFDIVNQKRDILTGGDGADVFLFDALSTGASRRTRDVILDFDPQVDHINFATGPGTRLDFIGDDAFSGATGQLRYDGYVLMGDLTGDGVTDFAIEIANQANLTAESLGF